VLAAWRASGRKKLLIAPAFPAAGRTTVAACVMVNGTLVHETAFACDPLNPVRCSSLPIMFGKAGLRLHTVSGADRLVEALAVHDAVVVDAATDEEMLSVAAMGLNSKDVLWAGSTGLLRALAHGLPMPANPRKLIPHGTRPAVVVGSLNPQSHLQREHAIARGMTVFSTPLRLGDSTEATQVLVSQVRNAVLAGEVDGLVVTGGETAACIARELQVDSVAVVGEVEAGIALCVARSPLGDMPWVTKAGGFGGIDVFARCVDAITGAHQ
jgi:D-threonate/D-erythronate kinase